jgi:hypothetical protein
MQGIRQCVLHAAREYARPTNGATSAAKKISVNQRNLRIKMNFVYSACFAVNSFFCGNPAGDKNKVTFRHGRYI